MKARLEKFKDVNEDENENNMKMVESDQEKSNESDSEGITAYQCRLLITFAYRLDPDQARQNVGPDLDPNYLTL